MPDHFWWFNLYGREPVLALVAIASRCYLPSAFFLIWVLWGPGTMFLAYLDGHLQTCEYDGIKSIGYLDDVEWLLGHWLLAPAIWTFAIYFGYAITETNNDLIVAGLFKPNRNLLETSPWSGILIGACGVLLGLWFGFVAPFRSRYFTEAITWRTLNTISLRTWLLTRVTVALTYYVAWTVTVRLALIAIHTPEIYSGRRFMIFHPDGGAGYGEVIRLYELVAFLMAVQLLYAIVIQYFDPMEKSTRWPAVEERSKRLSNLFYVGVFLWAAFAIAFYVVPVIGSQESVRVYKTELLSLTRDDFVKKIAADHRPLKVTHRIEVRSDVVATNYDEVRTAVKNFPEPKLLDFTEMPFITGIIVVIQFFLERSPLRRE